MKVNTKDVQVYGRIYGEQGVGVFTMVGKEGTYTVIDVKGEEGVTVAKSLYSENINKEYKYKGVSLVIKYGGHKVEDIKRGDLEKGFIDHVNLVNTVLSDLGVEEELSLREFISCVAYQALGVLEIEKRR